MYVDVDISPFHGIAVNVLQFLPHDILVLDLLRMASFLPELVFAIALVTFLVPRQLLQQHPNSPFLEVVDDPPSV